MRKKTAVVSNKAIDDFAWFLHHLHNTNITNIDNLMNGMATDYYANKNYVVENINTELSSLKLDNSNGRVSLNAELEIEVVFTSIYQYPEKELRELIEHFFNTFRSEFGNHLKPKTNKFKSIDAKNVNKAYDADITDYRDGKTIIDYHTIPHGKSYWNGVEFTYYMRTCYGYVADKLIGNTRKTKDGNPLLGEGVDVNGYLWMKEKQLLFYPYYRPRSGVLHSYVTYMQTIEGALSLSFDRDVVMDFPYYVRYIPSIFSEFYSELSLPTRFLSFHMEETR